MEQMSYIYSLQNSNKLTFLIPEKIQLYFENKIPVCSRLLCLLKICYIFEAEFPEFISYPYIYMCFIKSSKCLLFLAPSTLFTCVISEKDRFDVLGDIEMMKFSEDEITTQR